MDKNQIEELKNILIKERDEIEKELSEFAQKDKKEGWTPKYPDFKADVFEKDEEADEVEDFLVEVPLEHSLESRLKDINDALEKIEKGEYGKCEECGEEISYERLKANPEARTCINHAS